VIDCNAGQGISVFSTLTAIVIKEDVTDSMCDGDTYIFGTQTLTKAGTYTEIFVSAAGCDSTVNLTLSLITINTNVTSAGKTLTADIAGAQYQWVDCDNGFASIAGETDQVFVAAQNGNYAVIITYNGCTDTSACYPVTSVGIEDKQFDLDITLFPNPVADNLVIDWGENTGTVELKIMQLNGRLLITETLLNTSKTSIDVSGLVQGFYLIEINIDGNRSIQKFIKQ
jgi:type IX secretion system substrate protein